MNLGGLANLSSYSASDFLMFSPALYWRLFESLNAVWWPAPQLLIAALAASLWLGWRAQVTPRGREVVPAAARLSLLMLAVANAAAAALFLHQAFAPIMPTAGVAAWAFALQALGLLGWAVWAGGDAVALATGRQRQLGLGLLAWAALGHPALSILAGRPGQQAEWLGIAPDPTALATLGLLLMWQARSAASRWALRLLWAVPVAWCVLSGGLLLTMGSTQGWLLWSVGLLAVATARSSAAAQQLGR